MHWRLLSLFCLASVVALNGCAPSFSPLYRDFDIESTSAQTLSSDRISAGTDSASADAGPKASGDVYARIRNALAEAGWTEASSVVPNVVSTHPRQLSDWGLYRVVVSLDVVPVGGQHVRVLFHPVRRYITGGRSKIPYLDSGMRRTLLPVLNEAFEAHGLYPIGTPRERDEEQVEGT